MTRREELQKQYAEWERKLDELKEIAPENESLRIDRKGRDTLGVEAIYTVENDIFEITEYDADGPTGLVSLSGDEAEKLYHFLGGLYGE